MRTDHLYRQLCRLSTLRSAWFHVEEADGCAGVDAVSIAGFARNLDAELIRLSNELSKETYEPLPLVRFFVIKSNGGQRPLSVPAVRDRVAQHGVINVIGPRFEKEFDNCSFAYRKGRSVKQALQQIEFLHEAGYTWVLDADITSYFDNVDHGLLMARIAELVPSERILKLISAWIAARIYDGHQISQIEKGLPQGAPISPLLANLYLDAFDDRMLSQGQKLVRFADDFVVLCKSKPKAERALKLTKQIMSTLRLTLNDEKTRVTNFTEGFKYLGATFTGDLSLVRPPAIGAPRAEVFLPPPLPILRAAPIRSKPFNPAIKDAMLHAFEDISGNEIPSFFQRPRNESEPPAVARGSAASADVLRMVSGQSQSSTGVPPESESPALPGGPPLTSTVIPSVWSTELEETRDAVAEIGLSGSAPTETTVSALQNEGASAQAVLATTDDSGSDPPDGAEQPPPNQPKMPPPTLLTLRTLYVHEHGATIRCEDEHLRIFSKDGVELLSLPAFKIDQMILFGNSQVTTGAMKFCLRHNIPIIVLNGMGHFFGAIESTGNQNIVLQQKQFERLADQTFVHNTARQIVAAKISNSRTLLQRRHRDKPDNRLAQSINELLGLKSKLQSATTLDEIRGCEGAAAASYFVGFASCVPQSFAFSKRTRQPPLDPVNTLLSFGYTLLFYNIYAIVRARGLSPYVGSLHALRQGHPALCSDLIEELRAPVIDSLVTLLLNKMVFTPADFYYDDAGSAGILPAVPTSPSGCFLTDQARRTFVAQFEQRMNTLLLHPRARFRTTWRGCIDLQVTTYIKALRGELEMYLPLEIR
jgi:RNA-directed DNA polymerase